MKKFLAVLLIALSMMTGCNIKQVDEKNIGKMLDTLLSKKLALYNQTSNGYKYYIPRGMTLVDNTSYNEKLESSGNIYYLYVDVVSYEFKKEVTYTENKDAYFSLKLNYNNKIGYLEINKIKNLYFIEMVYNYAKIETFVPKKDIETAVTNACYILGTLKFNDKIIKTQFDEGLLDFSEQQFKIFEPKRKEGNFLDYVKEYDTYTDTNDDEDKVTPSDSNTTNENATE